MKPWNQIKGLTLCRKKFVKKYLIKKTDSAEIFKIKILFLNIISNYLFEIVSKNSDLFLKACSYQIFSIFGWLFIHKKNCYFNKTRQFIGSTIN